MSLLKNSRFYVLVFSFLLSALIYTFVLSSTPEGISQTIKLNKDYGLISIVYLYLALLIGPFAYSFKIIPKKIGDEIFHMRRAMGVSAFYFALLHFCISFFGQLEAFNGLRFLSNTYLFSLGIGFLALLILLVMASTSFDYLVDLMQFKNWKLLHRLVYFAGFLILIHVLILGSDFSDLSQIIPQITFAAVFFLLLLEAIRTDHFIFQKFKKRNFHALTISLIILSLGFVALQLLPQKLIPGLNIHAEHESKLELKQ